MVGGFHWVQSLLLEAPKRDVELLGMARDENAETSIFSVHVPHVEIG